MKQIQKKQGTRPGKSTCLPAGSLNDLASLFPSLGNGREQRTIDISGRRCLESFGRLSRPGSWARTFSALLIGMEGWYSSRCRLTWKLKGTKYNRMFFQLVPSTLPIEETGSGLYRGLLPTIAAQDATGIKNLRKDATVSDQGFHSMSLTHFAESGLLPTPNARDGKGRTGSGWTKQSSLPNALLPTVKTRDYQPSMSPVGMTRVDGKSRADNLSNLPVMLEEHCQQRPGTTSQLSPLFVQEMMGYPTDYLVLPFLNGETKV